jgi:RimJ/RimL family protein N-acetyltransferase
MAEKRYRQNWRFTMVPPRNGAHELEDLSTWTPRLPPKRQPMEGRFVRLEPLDAARHGDGLYEASFVPDADERFRWLGEYPPMTRPDFQPWLEKAQSSADPIYFAVIDKNSGKIAGRQTYLRTDAANGVTEIGHIYWGPLISKTPATTEALYLFARHVFDDLGYRRFEWKCNNRNEPSKRAAVRFGFQFEGVFRKHMIIKGESRDTAWYAMTDDDWAAAKPAFEEWLAPSNFDAGGRQVKTLVELRGAA